MSIHYVLVYRTSADLITHFGPTDRILSRQQYLFILTRHSITSFTLAYDPDSIVDHSGKANRLIGPCTSRRRAPDFSAIKRCRRSFNSHANETRTVHRNLEVLTMQQWLRANPQPNADRVALMLRVGLGLVFVIGGYSKLSQLLDPSRSDAMVALYMGPAGYINAFFSGYLFEGALGSVLTPWGFLTTLSAFELLSGIALIIGLLVRPLALLYGFLLWSFVIALPVVTTGGVVVESKTYLSPALLVQIRDVALSGLMFTLFNCAPGLASIDRRIFGKKLNGLHFDWDNLGLLTRLSLAAPLLVGGCFAGLDHIQSFAAAPLLLIVLGLALAGGIGVRLIGMVVVAVMLWFMLTKIKADASLIANLNGFKREFAFIGAGLVLAWLGGGRKFLLSDALPRRLRFGLGAQDAKVGAPTRA